MAGSIFTPGPIVDEIVTLRSSARDADEPRPRPTGIDDETSMATLSCPSTERTTEATLAQAMARWEALIEKDAGRA